MNFTSHLYLSKMINYIASERKRGKRRENRFITCRRCIQTTTFLYLCHESRCFVSCCTLFSSCLIVDVPRVISNADCVAWLYRQVRTRIFPWCGSRFSASTTCSLRQSTSFQDQDRYNRRGSLRFQSRVLWGFTKRTLAFFRFPSIDVRLCRTEDSCLWRQAVFHISHLRDGW